MFRLNLPKSFIPAFIFAVLILIGATISTEKLSQIQKSSRLLRILFSDHVFHFFAFGILTALIYWGYIKANSYTAPLLRACGITLVFGLFIEIYQLLIPYRFFSLTDLGVDAAGIFFTSFFIRVGIFPRC